MYGRNNQGARGGAEHLARIHGTEEDKVEILAAVVYCFESYFYLSCKFDHR